MKEEKIINIKNYYIISFLRYCINNIIPKDDINIFFFFRTLPVIKNLF